jgi:hypothetical protein
MSDTDRSSGARIAISPETRDDIRNQKRGGETYDRLLQKMIEQYDPDETRATE